MVTVTNHYGYLGYGNYGYHSPRLVWWFTTVCAIIRAADTDLVLQSAGDAGEPGSIPENLNLIGPLALNNVRAKAKS